MRLPRIFMVPLLMLPLNAMAAEALSCSDMRFLFEQSKQSFALILSEKESEFGGLIATKKLPQAQYCVILEDPEKRSYKCTWEYPIGDERARTAFEQYAKEVESCLGSDIQRVMDQPVNHPDTYKSFLYTLPDSEMRVTFKDKSELKSTLVSVVIEGIRFSRLKK